MSLKRRLERLEDQGQAEAPTPEQMQARMEQVRQSILEKLRAAAEGRHEEGRSVESGSWSPEKQRLLEKLSR